MKLLQVVSQFPPSPGYGIARTACDLGWALMEEGHEVHLLSMPPQDNGDDKLKRKDRIHRAHEKYPFFAYNETLESVLEGLPLGERLVALWEEEGPFDVILAHDWQVSHVASMGQRVFHVPLVAYFHGTQVGRMGGKGTREEIYISEMERWLGERADLVVSPSAFLRSELEKVYHLPPAKIAVIPEAPRATTWKAEVDHEDFRAMFAEPDEGLVLFSGRLSPEKGADILLEVIPEILRNSPGTRFVLAGDGPDRGPLQSRAKESGIEAQVRFTGHLGPLALGALYQVSDLLVVPSRYEAFGISVLEGLSHHLPVLATEVGGLPEVSELLGKSDLALIRPEDPSLFAQSILKQLMIKPERRNGTPPFQELMAPFRPESVGAQWLKALKPMGVAGVR